MTVFTAKINIRLLGMPGAPPGLGQVGRSVVRIMGSRMSAGGSLMRRVRGARPVIWGILW